MASALLVNRPASDRTRIQASLSWLACKQLCIIGKKRLELDLTVGARSIPSPHRDMFFATQSRLPEPMAAQRASLTVQPLENNQIHMILKLEGLESVERFIPRWFSTGGCKLITYSTGREAPGDFVADLTVSGKACLPEVSGIVQVKRKGAAKAEPSQFFDIGTLTAPVSSATVAAPTETAPQPGLDAGSAPGASLGESGKGKTSGSSCCLPLSAGCSSISCPASSRSLSLRFFIWCGARAGNRSPPASVEPSY